MSFTQNVKAELISLDDTLGCCDVAELAGILAFGLGGSGKNRKIITESAYVVRRLSILLKKLLGMNLQVTVAKQQIKGKQVHIYTVVLPDFGQVLQYVGLGAGRRVHMGVPAEVASQDCCCRAFIRGAFLGGGSVSSPEKRYHLEFVTAHFVLAKEFMALFDRFVIPAKMVTRRSRYVIYFKDSDVICDVLACIGASRAVMELYNVKIVKELKNRANREANSISANIDKTAEASVRQSMAIKKLDRVMGIDKLPDNLREIARLRLENPEMTLQDLGRQIDPPLGKSGVNHRLKRIIEMAKKIRE